MLVGGAFDPLGWSKGNLEDLKVKELKNGRLAMLAFLGFVAQYGATGRQKMKTCLGANATVAYLGIAASQT